jgi:predicted dehydrogenase
VLPDAELAAVGSRRRETAEAFGEKHRIARRYASYEALAADPEVDVVYVATPHPMHKENALLCLRAGKAVLCEKPFAINAAEGRAMADAARQASRFLMEAMWTRFLPATIKAREIVRSGAIGEVRFVKADLCFRAGWNPEGRLLNPALGGGALLDVGIYTVAWAAMLLGATPSRISALSHLGPTGVDEQSAVVLGYDDGRLAQLSCAVRTSLPHESIIAGTDGLIRVHHPFWHASRLTISAKGKEETLDLPYEHNGYQYEAAEVMRCLREDRIESDVMPVGETLAILALMDRIRAAVGLRYPMEQGRQP